MKLLTVILLFINLLVIVKSQTHKGCFSIVEFDGDKNLTTPQIFINVKNISKYGGVNLRVSISIPPYVSIKNYEDAISVVNQTENQLESSNNSMSIKWKFIFPEDVRTELLEIAVNEEVYECRDTEDYPRILNYQYYLPLEKNPRDTVVNEVCSKPKDIGNIKNFSTTSDPSQWPWLALIFSRTNDTRTHVCSGSFITNRHVLTTASCVLSNNGLEIGYRVNELVETDYDNTTAVYYKLKNLRIHPRYGSNLEANIAILEITDDDIETRNIDQVCIWSLPEAGELYMTDWNEEKQFQQLKFVINKTVDCLDMYPNVLANDNSPFLNEDDIFCATVIDKNTSYYNYFSKEGNGLVAYDSDNDEYYLRGMLTSFFDVYSADGFFINLEEYYTWIKHATETMY